MKRLSRSRQNGGTRSEAKGDHECASVHDAFLAMSRNTRHIEVMGTAKEQHLKLQIEDMAIQSGALRAEDLLAKVKPFLLGLMLIVGGSAAIILAAY